MLHIILVNMQPSIWEFHSLCEKVCYVYFLGSKGRSITSRISHRLCVRKIVMFNLLVVVSDIIVLCWLQEDEDMKRFIRILMTLLLRNHPPKANGYDLKLVCLSKIYSSCFDVFQILYMHVLFLTFIFVILAKS